MKSHKDYAGAQKLLTEIVALWEKLEVPLLHRSRFFLDSRGRDLMYLEAEQRRLATMMTKYEAAEEGSQEQQEAERTMEKAQRELQVGFR